MASGRDFRKQSKSPGSHWFLAKAVEIQGVSRPSPGTAVCGAWLFSSFWAGLVMIGLTPEHLWHECPCCLRCLHTNWGSPGWTWSCIAGREHQPGVLPCPWGWPPPWGAEVVTFGGLCWCHLSGLAGAPCGSLAMRVPCR